MWSLGTQRRGGATSDPAPTTAAVKGRPRHTPGSLDVLRPVHVTQLAQAEAVPSRRVHVAIHRHGGTRGLDLERLANLDVHLKVGDGAPVLRGWVVGDGGLEGDLIGYGPCNNTALITLALLNSLFYMFYLIMSSALNVNQMCLISVNLLHLHSFKGCGIKLCGIGVNKTWRRSDVGI